MADDEKPGSLEHLNSLGLPGGDADPDVSDSEAALYLVAWNEIPGGREQCESSGGAYASKTASGKGGGTGACSHPQAPF